MTLQEVRQRLDEITQEMTRLIKDYRLDASSPLEVLPEAKKRIGTTGDYVRFLELSLEGRILADEGERLMKGREVSH